jgi:SAM-dependent methyltransferase
VGEATTQTEHTDAATAPGRGLQALSLRRLAIELVAASFVVLVQELTLIRWLPGQVRVLAYYPNLVLLAAFLGLGLGCLVSRGRSWRPAWPLLTLATVGAALGLSRVVFTQEGVSEHLFLLYYDLPPGSPVFGGVWPPILLFFLMVTLTFVPLGQFVAERLDEFRRRGQPLRGYSWDLTGSLVGVVAFAVLGLTGTFPVVWFTAFLLPSCLLVVRTPRWLALYLVLGAGVLAAVHVSERGERYSPYYVLNAVPRAGWPGHEILANGSLHQVALPLHLAPAPDPYTHAARTGYRIPYQLLERPPGRVLVLGAGTGNDVAVALQMGAEHVDAVEIDPEILDLGRSLHPARPYDSTKVRLINTDARAFLNATDEKYDLVVLGTLDSLTRLSALSNVRLDNFVYTREGLHAIRGRLGESGALIMYFMVATDYIDARLAGMAAEACGEVPVIEREHHALFNRIYMCGPGFAHVDGERRKAEVGDVLARLQREVELPSDDWPYLYLARRGVSGFYWGLALAFAAIAVVGVAVTSPTMRRGLRGGAAPDWSMFCFGAGFLLIETRAVTEMNLLWSATWLTSAIVFAAILATILGATVLAAVRPVRYELSTLGVVLALLVTWATPTAALLRVDWGLKLLFAVLFVGLPAFFAALCFAALFRGRRDVTIAFGWNLLGAVAGGLLELGAMAVGFKALHLVALAAYLMAFLAWKRETLKTEEGEWDRA